MTMPNAAPEAGHPFDSPLPIASRAELDGLLALNRLRLEPWTRSTSSLPGCERADPDMEPSLGYFAAGQVVDAEEEHNGAEPDQDSEPEEEDQSDREPYMGWAEKESQVILRCDDDERDGDQFCLTPKDVALRANCASRAVDQPFGLSATCKHTRPAVANGGRQLVEYTAFQLAFEVRRITIDR
jgi:hypothetical protein